MQFTRKSHQKKVTATTTSPSLIAMCHALELEQIPPIAEKHDDHTVTASSVEQAPDPSATVSDIAHIGEELGLTVDNDTINPHTAADQLDTRELCNEFLNDIPVTDCSRSTAMARVKLEKCDRIQNTVDYRDGTNLQLTKASIQERQTRALSTQQQHLPPTSLVKGRNTILLHCYYFFDKILSANILYTCRYKFLEGNSGVSCVNLL